MAKSRIQDRREFDPDSACPTCGAETETGFGLAGGGYGPYTYCPSCEIVTSKSSVIEVERATLSTDTKDGGGA